MNIRVFVAVFLCCVCMGTSPGLFAAEINGMRVWSSPEKTRAVFDLGATVNYRLFTLSNPERVVIDIQKGRLDGRLPLDRKRAGVVKNVRYGKSGKQGLRIVLDLQRRADAKSFLLAPTAEYGHRLVVDLHAQSEIRKVKHIRDFAQQRDRDVVIAIDAGHGGEDPGAVGAKKTYEKDVVLAIARELKRRIDAERGMRAFLVRDGDYYIPHQQRYEKARKKRADLFVSIHADAFKDRRVQGSSVYVLSRRGASSEFARRLAQKENRSDLVGGVSLDDKDDVLASVLLDLSQNATMEASNQVAKDVLRQLQQIGPTHKNHVGSAAFIVLKSPDVPSILVETAFISNPAEEKRLNDKKHQRRLARSITAGIKTFFSNSPPPGSWFASHAQPTRHVVVRGDTLGEIAQRYQISLRDLRSANRLKNDNISIGKELVIPTG